MIFLILRGISLMKIKITSHLLIELRDIIFTNLVYIYLRRLINGLLLS